MTPRGGRIAALAIVALLLATVAVRLVSPYVRTPATAFAESDFIAFGCGVRVADAGGDPYLAAPLRACQHAVVPGPPPATDPAPYPPYFFAVLAPLGRMPFRLAADVWLAALLTAIAIAGVALRRLTGLPWWIVAPPVVLLLGRENVPYLEIPPFVVALVALAALALRAGRDRLAALAIAATAIEPHVAVPLWLALAIVRPRARLVLLACGVALAAAGVFAVPPGLWHEYLADALPTQAVAEAPFRIQYTLTYVLLALGCKTVLAVRLGSIDYAVTVVVAAAVAAPLARRMRDPAVAVTFPAAAILLGGVYVHLTQMAIALPFAFQLLARAGATGTRRDRAGAAAIVGLLACGWPVAHGHFVALVSLATAATLAAYASRGLAARRRAVAIAAACAAYVVVAVAVGHVPGTVRHAPSAAAFAARYDPALAATQDGLEMRRDGVPLVIRSRDLSEKVPVWLALIGLWGAAIAALRRPASVAAQASASVTSSRSRGAGTMASAIPP